MTDLSREASARVSRDAIPARQEPAAGARDLEREVFDYRRREKEWCGCSLMESHGKWFDEAKKAWAEAERLKKETSHYESEWLIQHRSAMNLVADNRNMAAKLDAAEKEIARLTRSASPGSATQGAGETPDAGATEEVGDCWLVWALTAQGQVTLLAVDVSESVAERHRKFALAPMLNYVRVYVEHAKTNHLYGETIFNDRNPSSKVSGAR